MMTICYTRPVAVKKSRQRYGIEVLNVKKTPSSQLSLEELNAIAEIEATTNILKLIVRVTGLRFAAIVKFCEKDWVACSVNDEICLGIKNGENFPLEYSMCSNLLANPTALVVDCVSQHFVHRSNVAAGRYGFESSISIPIFLRDNTLFGSICVLDPDPNRLDVPESVDVLVIFAKLVGSIFQWHYDHSHDAAYIPTDIAV